MQCPLVKQKCSYDMLTIFYIHILVLAALASVVEIKATVALVGARPRSVAEIKELEGRLRSVLEEGENFSKTETFHNICFAHAQSNLL